MIADDFAAIAARLRDVASPLAPKIEVAPEPEPDQVCTTCEGGGWAMAAYQPSPPNFEVCPDCGNPEGHPQP